MTRFLRFKCNKRKSCFIERRKKRLDITKAALQPTVEKSETVES